jgi:chromate transport protein ChrA
MVSRGFMTLTRVYRPDSHSEMTAGPFVVNAATFAGMHLSVSEARLATLGITLPSMILCLIAAAFSLRSVRAD